MGYDKIAESLTDEQLDDIEFVEKVLLGNNEDHKKQVREKYKLSQEQLEAFVYYTNLRQEILQNMAEGIENRIESNPTATPEELSMGDYIENTQPQVREAVQILRKKGYNTQRSGFVMPNHRQTIEFTDASLKDYQPSEQLADYLKENEVELEVENESISFKSLKHLPEEKLAEIWLKVAENLPDLEKVAGQTEQPEALAFRESQESLKVRKYDLFVKENEFGNFKKTASDLALVLDSWKTKDAWEYKSREEVFAAFCALCAKAGVKIPPLEEEYFTLFEKKTDEIPEPVIKAAKDVSDKIEAAIKGVKGPAAKEAMLLASFISTFPQLMGKYGNELKKRDYFRKVNKLFRELGLEMLRPDYASMEVKTYLDRKGPEKPAKVLIVDDSMQEIGNTMRSIAGWPNLEVGIYQQGVGVDYMIDPAKKAAELEKTARAIIAASPQIALMDQGMREVDGDKLVTKIRELDPNCTILFVANSGGDAKELRNVGCYPNFSKGKGSYGGLQQAIDSLSSNDRGGDADIQEPETPQL